MSEAEWLGRKVSSFTYALPGGKTGYGQVVEFSRGDSISFWNIPESYDLDLIATFG